MPVFHYPCQQKGCVASVGQHWSCTGVGLRLSGCCALPRCVRPELPICSVQWSSTSSSPALGLPGCLAFWTPCLILVHLCFPGDQMLRDKSTVSMLLITVARMCDKSQGKGRSICTGSRFQADRHLDSCPCSFDKSIMVPGAHGGDKK